MSDRATATSSRLQWVDVLKFLGIFAIYVGHFRSAAGPWFHFVFTYHVPLFFLAAGFFAPSSRKYSLRVFLVKKIKGILLPYLFFCLLFTLVAMLRDEGVGDPWTFSKDLLLGIRNQTPSYSLWFLPCLFVLSVAWELIYRATRSVYYTLAFSTVLWVLSVTVLPNNPVSDPAWAFNVDSAMYYIIYYAIGAAVFPVIRGGLAGVRSRITKVTAWSVMVLAAAVALLVFFEKDPLGNLDSGILWSIKMVVYALLIIYLNIALSFALSRFGFLAKMGQQTLFYCGNEAIVKVIIPVALGLFGLTLPLNSPLIVILYSLLLLVVSYPTIVKFEAKLLSRLFRHPFWIESPRPKHPGERSVTAREESTAGNRSTPAGDP